MKLRLIPAGLIIALCFSISLTDEPRAFDRDEAFRKKSIAIEEMRRQEEETICDEERCEESFEKQVEWTNKQYEKKREFEKMWELVDIFAGELDKGESETWQAKLYEGKEYFFTWRIASMNTMIGVNLIDFDPADVDVPKAAGGDLVTHYKVKTTDRYTFQVTMKMCGSEDNDTCCYCLGLIEKEN